MALGGKVTPVNAKSLLIGSNMLLTGGTGSFGRQFVRTVLEEYQPQRLVIFSRDELKQHEMQSEGFHHPCLRYFIGDVRDVTRLRRAMHGVDIVVHSAALKQVPACEYNPIEAIETNVTGARNIIDAALDTGVQRVLALSTDKAVSPVNLYGATKLCAEKLFVQSNAYASGTVTRFSCVRYGNVVGSRGSVIPLFARQRRSGQITITDPRMTRFWITLDQGVRFVIDCLDQMHGGEVFVPKIPSMNIMDLAQAIAADCQIRKIGVRPGEKLHESLISEDEARQTLELHDKYLIQPSHPWWSAERWPQGKPLPEGFCYTSDNNTQWLNIEQLQAMCEEIGVGGASLQPSVL